VSEHYFSTLLGYLAGVWYLRFFVILQISESKFDKNVKLLKLQNLVAILVSLFFVVPIYANRQFVDSGGVWSIWSTYLSILLISFSVMAAKTFSELGKFRTLNFPRPFFGVSVFLCAAVFYKIAFSQLNAIHFQNKTDLSDWDGTLVILSVAVVCGVVLATVNMSRSFRINWVIHLPLIFLIVISILSAPWGIYLVGITKESVLLTFVFAFFTTAMFWKYLVLIPNNLGTSVGGKLQRKYSAGSLLTIAVLLSLRIDAVSSIPGSYFHLGYFSGVIQTIRSGGLLLWDTPSQYGYLNLVLASWIPVSDSRTALLVFQALLLIVVFSIVLSTLSQRFSNQWAFLTAGVIFLVALYFADPYLEGPQPFPSSSVVRFGPSIVLVAWLSSQKMIREMQSRNTKWITAGLVAIGIVWSAESLVYVAFIFSAWCISAVALADKSQVKSILRTVLGPIIGYVVAGCSFLVGVITLKRLIINHQFPDWALFLTAPMKFAQGFGSMPQKINSPVWLFVGLVAFVSCIILVEPKQAEVSEIMERAVLGAVIGGLLGWGTYYTGRAVAENIVAMYPEFVLCALLVVSVVMRTNQDSDALLSGFHNWLKQSTLVLCVVAMSVVSVAIVGQSGFVGNIANFRFMPQDLRYDKLIYASPDLRSALLETKEKLIDEGIDGRVSIVFEGWAGIMPQLDNDLSNFYEVEVNWIPVPLALLEEPIPKDVRERLISRFVLRNQKSGVLILDKLSSFPDRFVEWLNVLKPYYSCHDVVNSRKYQSVYCEYRQ